MEDTLKRLEKKLYHDDQDQSDFLKVKDIYARVFEKRRGETAENHTAPQYIWRTAGDGKVRDVNTVKPLTIRILLLLTFSRNGAIKQAQCHRKKILIARLSTVSSLWRR